MQLVKLSKSLYVPTRVQFDFDTYDQTQLLSNHIYTDFAILQGKLIISIVIHCMGNIYSLLIKF